MAPDRRGPQEIGVGVGECTQEDNNNSKSPTEPLREELRKQATPDVMGHAMQLANTLAYRIAARGGIGGALRASELLYDALADTWLGSVHWDPNRKPLAQHLEDTLSWRARDAAQAAARTVFCGIFTHDEEADESDDESAQDEGIPRMPISAVPDIPQHEDDPTEPARLLAKLRRASEDDEEVTAVLLALQRHPTGQVRRAAMAAVPGMTLKRYQAARARLMYLAKRCAGGEGTKLHAVTERHRVTCEALPAVVPALGARASARSRGVPPSCSLPGALAPAPAAPKRTLRAPRSRKVGALGGVLPPISARNREP